jgi:hypothetical protein
MSSPQPRKWTLLRIVEDVVENFACLSESASAVFSPFSLQR